MIHTSYFRMNDSPDCAGTSGERPEPILDFFPQCHLVPELKGAELVPNGNFCTFDSSSSSGTGS